MSTRAPEAEHRHGPRRRGRSIREIDDDPAAQVHGDAQHFWPYGLNYKNEVKSDAALLAHSAMATAIRADIYP